MLDVKTTANIALDGNKAAAKLAAELTAGNILNDRLFKMAIPHLPTGASMFLNNPAGKALLANAFAAGLVHFLPTNGKAVQASGYMVQSAMIELTNSFEVEKIVNEFLDGVTLPTQDTKEPDAVDLTDTLKEAVK